jgi:hypothetical protein
MGSTNPRFMAARPVMTVVATPPFAPISQSPIRPVAIQTPLCHRGIICRRMVDFCFTPVVFSNGVPIPEVCHVNEILTGKKYERKNSWKKLLVFN